MSLRTVPLVVACLFLSAVGCTSTFPVEYYPTDHMPMTTADTQKGGDDYYGGTNSSYNTVTPGSPAATNTAVPPISPRPAMGGASPNSGFSPNNPGGSPNTPGGAGGR